MTLPPTPPAAADSTNVSTRFRVLLHDPYGARVGEVTLGNWDTTAFRIVSPKPFPPGARISLALVEALGADADPRLSFRMKVHRCRRDEAGTFEISGALMDTRRETIAALRAMTGRTE